MVNLTIELEVQPDFWSETLRVAPLMGRGRRLFGKPDNVMVARLQEALK